MADVGTEVMLGVGTNSKEAVSVEKMSEQVKVTPESQNKEKMQAGEGAGEERTSPKTMATESPGKGKGGTPKKGDPRSMFTGSRPSPKKNPWTRNTSSEGGKESAREVAVTTVAGRDPEVKGIEIPKGEVSLWGFFWQHVCLCFGSVCMFWAATDDVCLCESEQSLRDVADGGLPGGTICWLCMWYMCMPVCEYVGMAVCACACGSLHVHVYIQYMYVST